MDRQGGRAARAHSAHGRRGQLLGHGRHRALRPRLGDLLRHGGGLRARRRAPGRRRRALRRDLEPGLHGAQPRRRRCPDRAAAQEHRHRRRPGADPALPPGARVHLRHRPVRADHRRGGLRPRHRLRDRPGHRRRAARPGRPRPGLLHARGGRGAARQRGPGVRAAPGRAPRRPGRPPRRGGEAHLPHARAGGHRGAGRGLPRTAGPAGSHRQRGGARGGRFRPHPARRVEPVGGGARHRGEGARWPGGLHPARHPRLPGRADRGVGARRRGGGGPGRLRCRHGGPAGAGTRRGHGLARRRRGGLPGAARRGGPDLVRRPGRRELRGCRPACSPSSRVPTPTPRPTPAKAATPRAGWWRSSWTGRPSTPRAAGRSATPGPSSPSRASPTSTTPCWPCRGWWRTGRGSAARCGRGRTPWPRSTGSAGRPSGATTRRPICCIPRCEPCSATTCASRVPSCRPTTCASTSRTTASRRAKSSTRSSRGRTTPC